MGWISKRYMKTNRGLSKGREISRRASAPLREIIGFVRIGDNTLFGSGDRMKLECGHEVFTKATHKARCIHCKIEQEKLILSSTKLTNHE